jgi:hypothetical protein
MFLVSGAEEKTPASTAPLTPNKLEKQLATAMQ